MGTVKEALNRSQVGFDGRTSRSCNQPRRPPPSGAFVETELFNYELPAELIAQAPAARREDSRLLCLNRMTGTRTHTTFARIIDQLRAGDVMVFNDSKVIPARLHGIKEGSAGRVEFLLLERVAPDAWWAMLRPGKRLRPGTEVRLVNRQGQPTELTATVTDKNEEGHGLLRFSGSSDVDRLIESIGEMPLPPYIRQEPENATRDLDRYQTVYAREPGSVAAPTAGLHFSHELLTRLREHGVETHHVTLRVGLGTFAPVKSTHIDEHRMHEESFTLSAETAAGISRAKAEGRRVIAVGTTSVRVLESVAAANAGQLVPGDGRTRIFIHPPAGFRIVDGLVTNFHLPCSTLLMLVSAFASPGNTDGIELVRATYAEAIANRYRFFSYGDAMLIHS